eukprot:412004-Rhodomonas_salina.1
MPKGSLQGGSACLARHPTLRARDLCIGSRKPEAAHNSRTSPSSSSRRISAYPWQHPCGDVQEVTAENFGVEGVEPGLSNELIPLQAQHRLDERRDTRRCQCVPDICLHAADNERLRPILQHTSDRVELHWIPQLGPRAVHLTVVHIIAPETCTFEGRAQQRALRLGIRSSQHRAPPILVHRSRRHHR